MDAGRCVQEGPSELEYGVLGGMVCLKGSIKVAWSYRIGVTGPQ